MSSRRELRPRRRPVVDEWGRVPSSCVETIDEDDIPLAIRLIEFRVQREFALKRQHYGMSVGWIGYPENQRFREWGRWWIIKPSTIPLAGLGLFADEDIILDREASVVPSRKVTSIPLFPYVGAHYTLEEHDKLLPWYPGMRRYSLQVTRGSYRNLQQLMLVGFARKDRNLASYINSCTNISRRANAEWHEVDQRQQDFPRYIDSKCQTYLDCIQDQREIQQYCMTVATKTIYSGQELFIDYDIGV